MANPRTLEWCQSTIDSLEQELQRVRSDYHKIAAAYTDSENPVEAQKDHINRLAADLETSQDTVSSYQTVIHSLNEQMSALHTELKNAEAINAELHGAMADLAAGGEGGQEDEQR